MLSITERYTFNNQYEGTPRGRAIAASWARHYAEQDRVAAWAVVKKSVGMEARDAALGVAEQYTMKAVIAAAFEESAWKEWSDSEMDYR